VDNVIVLFPSMTSTLLFCYFHDPAFYLTLTGCPIRTTRTPTDSNPATTLSTATLLAATTSSVGLLLRPLLLMLPLPSLSLPLLLLLLLRLVVLLLLLPPPLPPPLLV
jgi:hypothetical protein